MENLDEMESITEIDYEERTPRTIKKMADSCEDVEEIREKIFVHYSSQRLAAISWEPMIHLGLAPENPDDRRILSAIEREIDRRGGTPEEQIEKEIEETG